MGKRVRFPGPAVEPHGAVLSASADHTLSGGHMNAAGPMSSKTATDGKGARAKAARIRLYRDILLCMQCTNDRKCHKSRLSITTFNPDTLNRYTRTHLPYFPLFQQTNLGLTPAVKTHVCGQQLLNSVINTVQPRIAEGAEGEGELVPCESDKINTLATFLH